MVLHGKKVPVQLLRELLGFAKYTSLSRRRFTAGVASVLIAAPGVGCNQVASRNGVPESGPDPTYRDVIAGHLKTTFKDY